MTERHLGLCSFARKENVMSKNLVFLADIHNQDGVVRANYDAFVDGLGFDPKTNTFVLLLEEASDTDSEDSETIAFIMGDKVDGKDHQLLSTLAEKKKVQCIDMEGMESGDSKDTYSRKRQLTMAKNIKAVVDAFDVQYYIVVVGQAHLTTDMKGGPLQNFKYGGVEIWTFDTVELRLLE